MTSRVSDVPDRARSTRVVQWLIALSAAVYFVQVTVVGAENMQHALGFARDSVSGSWWTVGTFLFVHAGFWHVALNVYTLYLFGPRIEQSWSAQVFLGYYVLCGLGGLFLFALFARDGMFIGSSAAVLGVAFAYGSRWPGDEVRLSGVIQVRAAWLVGGLVAVNLIAGVVAGGPGGGVAYLAHAGGLGAAWLYSRAPTGSGLDRLRQRVSPVPDVPDEPPRAIPRSLPRSRERGRDIDDIVAQSHQALSQRNTTVAPAPDQPAPETPDLDRVLDKISERGLDSLTNSERLLLETRSRELRQHEKDDAQSGRRVD